MEWIVERQTALARQPSKMLQRKNVKSKKAIDFTRISAYTYIHIQYTDEEIRKWIIIKRLKLNIFNI